MAEKRMGYADVRPYTVPETLEELTGPTGGIVELPVRIDWSGSPLYDLDDGRMVSGYYERVIRESASVADLRRYLNAQVLKSVWRDLFLPPRVCQLWEQRFPELTAARKAA
jgi:hypothetical protein